MPPDRTPGTPARWLRALGWEFLQNLPLVAGFLLGLAWWQQDRPGVAILCIVGGAMAGSAIIWATESRIVPGHREPLRVVLMNVAVFSGLMFVLMVYLTAGWSRWWTDLLLGAAGGILLAVAQDLAARSPVGLTHCAAMAAAFALALVGIRGLAAWLPVAANVLLVTGFATVVIGVIDYGPGTEALRVAQACPDRRKG